MSYSLGYSLVASPAPFIPADATIQPYPSLPSVTTTVPVAVAPGITVPMTTTIQPRFPLVPELDLDNDYTTRTKISDYFYFRTIDKWLYEDLVSLLKYLTVSGNNVKIVKGKKAKLSDDTQAKAELKIKFIETYVFSKDDMYKILKRFTEENGIKWVDLIKRFSSDVKYLVKKKIQSRLEGKMKD